MIVIAVKESSFLIAVDAVVGGVEVENQMSRRRRVGGDELIDQDFGDLDERLSIEPILQSAQGRRRGEGRALLGRFADGDLQAGIDAKLLMIVEVFISEGDGDDALGDHNALIVDDEEGVFSGRGSPCRERRTNRSCRRPREARSPRRWW